MGGRRSRVALRVADGVEGGEVPRPQPRVLLHGLLWFRGPVTMNKEEGLHRWLEDQNSIGILGVSQGIKTAAQGRPEVI